MSTFEDHMNLLIKMTKISNPTGDLAEMRVRLHNICNKQITDFRPEITIATWGSQDNVDWQISFVDRCQISIDSVFQEDSARWQIGYTEIA